MLAPLQAFMADALGELLLLLIVPFLIVLFGTYLGVLMALQSFFGESSWREVVEEASGTESTD